MQRDTHLRFSDIYDSPKAMQASIEKILDLAYIKAINDEPFKLRFITPCSIEEWKKDVTYNSYRVTTLEEHVKNTKYVAVSYCWKQTQSVEDWLAIPTYQLRDALVPGGTATRTLNCPLHVFHRAVSFARELDCPYLWIDQECIDQSDPADIEMHLQIMHRVYSESMATVSPLSTPIPTTRQLDALSRLTPYDWVQWLGKSAQEQELAEAKARPQRQKDDKDNLQTLCHIAQDAWFTRTWTLQERVCATITVLIIPIGAGVAIPEEFKSGDIRDQKVLGGDLFLNMRRINGPLSNYHNRETFTSNRDMTQVKQIYELSFKYTTGLDECHLGMWKQFFELMERCDNLVLADRISIYANGTKMWHRLLSDRLNKEENSYSTCILILVLMASGNVDDARGYIRDYPLQKVFSMRLEDVYALSPTF